MAAGDYTIPRANSPISDSAGVTTSAWYNYLRFIGTTSQAALLQDIQIISTKLGSPDGTPEGIPAAGSGSIIGAFSVKVFGSLPGTVNIRLENDSQAIADTSYYGTDITGSRGWFTVASAFASSANIIQSVSGTGITSFDLVDLADSGIGTLLAITRDSKGRVSGTRAATITGTTNRVTVTNGTAAAGLPTIDIAATYVGQTSITTVGTITVGVWNGTAIDASHGGTGQTVYTIGDMLYASSTSALSKLGIGSTGFVLRVVGGVPTWGADFVGTVTSVGLALPVSVFSISGAPVTSSGTLTGSFITQTANTLFAGPTTGASATPTFRSLVSADIPALDFAKITTGIVPIVQGGTGQTTANAGYNALSPMTTNGDIEIRAAGIASRLGIGTTGQVLTVVAGLPAWSTSAGTGTVTSVALAMPADFTVSGSPVTTAGTLTAAYATQAANVVHAGPASGAAATPTWRALVATDIPWASDHMNGLHGLWVSASSIGCAGGECVTASGSYLATGPLTLSGLSSLTASTFYYCYIFNNSGTPAIELVTTAPAAPYNGSARAKTGDTTRRLLFPVLVDASGNINAFQHIGSMMAYMANIAPAQFTPLSGGTATTLTNVSCTGAVPPISTLATLLAVNNSVNADVAIGTPGAGFTTSASAFNQYVAATKYLTCLQSLSTSQQFNYLLVVATTGSGFAVRVQGYMFDR